MITQIIKIEKKKNNNDFYYIIYFNFFNEIKFTYMTKKSIDYFKKYHNLKRLFINQRINIIVKNKFTQYQIIEFIDKK